MPATPSHLPHAALEEPESFRLTPDTPLVCMNTELPIAPWRVNREDEDAASLYRNAPDSCPCQAHDVMPVSWTAAHLFMRGDS
jgi:hypothetical protein